LVKVHDISTQPLVESKAYITEVIVDSRDHTAERHMSATDRSSLRTMPSMPADPLTSVKALTILKINNPDNTVSNEQASIAM
jgi:hypothetical protein